MWISNSNSLVLNISPFLASPSFPNSLSFSLHNISIFKPTLHVKAASFSLRPIGSWQRLSYGWHMLATWWVLRWHQVSVFRIRMPRVSKEESFESLSLTESSNDDENENNDSVSSKKVHNNLNIWSWVLWAHWKTLFPILIKFFFLFLFFVFKKNYLTTDHQSFVRARLRAF